MQYALLMLVTIFVLPRSRPLYPMHQATFKVGQHHHFTALADGIYPSSLWRTHG